jgi:MFS family permease
MTQPTEQPQPLFYGWWVAGASFTILLVTVGIGLYGPPVFLVPLQEHFGWSRAAIAGGSAVAGLTAGLVAPLVGILIDRYGSRRVMVVGALVMGSAFCLLSAVQSLWQLYALNVIAAVGISCVAWIPNQTLISNWFTRKRGLAMGITNSGIGFGGLAMPILAGFLIGDFGWRVAFMVLGSVVLVVVVTVTVLVVRSKPEDMGLLPDGEPMAPEPPGGAPSEGIEEGSAVAGLTLQQAFRTGAFWMLSLTHVLWTFGSMSAIGHFPAFLRDLGFDDKRAAAYLGFAIGFSVAGRLSLGPLADRVAKRRLMSLALLVHALAMLCLFPVDSPTSLLGFVILFGMGLGGAAVLVPLLIGEFFGLRTFGGILGVVTISATLGAAVGPVVTGRIFDVTGSYHQAFILHIISFTAAAVVIYFIRRPKAINLLSSR